MSACNNLRQYGIPFSLTKMHTVSPDAEEFEADLDWFAVGLPRRQRAAASARRLHRRAAGRLQYGALQRENPRGAWHFDRRRSTSPTSWAASANSADNDNGVLAKLDGISSNYTPHKGIPEAAP